MRPIESEDFERRRAAWVAETQRQLRLWASKIRNDMSKELSPSADELCRFRWNGDDHTDCPRCGGSGLESQLPLVELLPGDRVLLRLPGMEQVLSGKQARDLSLALGFVIMERANAR